MAENWVREVGAKLAEYDEEHRERLLAQIQMLSVAQAPDEEVAKAPITPLGDYLLQEIENPGAIIEPGLFVPGEITLFHARAGKGKSTFALNRMIRWAAGLPMLAGLPDIMVPAEGRPVKSLIVENEGSAGMFQERVRDILTHSDMTEEQTQLARENVLIWGDGSYSGIKVDTAADFDLLRRGVSETRPDILFLDPFRSIWTGDENDLSAMEAVLDKLQSLASEFQLAVYLPHHERKSNENPDGMDAARGGTTLEGKVATMERWQHVRGGAFSEVSWTKMRYAPRTGIPAPVRVVFDFETYGYVYVGEDALDRQIIQTMEAGPSDWYYVKDLADDLGEGENKVRARLKALSEGDDPALERRSGERSRGGAPGFRYRLRREGEAEPGGLPI